MLYVLWEIVLHVVCIVGYSYTCSMYCGGYSYTCNMYCGISHTCSMYCGIQLYMWYVLWDTVILVVCIVGYSYTCGMYCGIQLYM